MYVIEKNNLFDHDPRNILFRVMILDTETKKCNHSINYLVLHYIIIVS